MSNYINRIIPRGSDTVMGYVTGTDSRQMTMGVWSIEDEVPQDSPARFIEIFVDSLDLETMGFEHTVPAPTGRPPYNPYDLVKLYVWGYLNKIRSSRRLMRECHRNIELWFLLNRLCPDFRTIADFRKAHRKLLKKIFLIFVRACKEMKLMDAETLCLDGTTVRAVNGRKQSTSAELSRKKLEYARAQLEAVEKYLDSMDENDLCEGRIDHPFALDLDKDHLPSVETLRERIAFHEKCLKELEKSGRNSLTFTDPESAMMPAKEGGIKACYNVQTAVDAKSHMVADFHVTNNSSDRGQLYDSIEMCRRDLSLDAVNAIADKGYESAADIRDCLMNGIVPDVGFIQDREDRVFPLDYVEQNITPDMRASTKPEDIQACLHAGILPDCYQGTNIRIEVQSLSNISCFIRHEDGRVTCPMGRELLKQRDTKYGTEYSSREACRTCPNRCTDSKREKHVNIGRNSTYVPVIMYGDSRYPLQQIPDVEQDTPYNHFGKWKRDEKRVMIFIKRDIPRQKLRQQTSEHPFGTIKHYDDGRYFLCKGKEKVTAEFSLSALAYNIRRAINICGGVHNLIDRYRRIAMPKIRKIAEF